MGKNQTPRSLANAGFSKSRGLSASVFFLPLPPPPPLSFFLALVSFLARPKPRIPFHGLSLLRNQTETLATQAKLNLNFTIGLIQPNNNETCFLKDYHISDPLWIYMYNTPYPGTVISTIPQVLRIMRIMSSRTITRELVFHGFVIYQI